MKRRPAGPLEIPQGSELCLHIMLEQLQAPFDEGGRELPNHAGEPPERAPARRLNSMKVRVVGARSGVALVLRPQRLTFVVDLTSGEGKRPDLIFLFASYLFMRQE